MIARWRWAGALLVSVGTVGGCMVTGEIGYNCDPSIYEEGHRGPDGKPDFCHRKDPPEAGGACAVGECVLVPGFWKGPVLLWAGQAGQAPECETGPTGVFWEGHADLVAPSECEACTCAPPTGSCELSSTLTASTKACNLPGGVTASFDAPVPWDGHCDTAAQVPAGVAASLTIAPLTMTENGCMPGPPVAAKVVSSPSWATDVRACHGAGFLPCLDTGSACISTEDPVEFRVCIAHEGNFDCPTIPGTLFTEQHIFYKGITDDRQCSACTCGPPMGSLCTAVVSVYQNAGGMCGGPIVDQGTVSSVSPRCVDIQPPGQALGSKSAGPTTYIPGACAPMGGDPSGLATESESFTFCCRPNNVSQPAP